MIPPAVRSKISPHQLLCLLWLLWLFAPKPHLFPSLCSHTPAWPGRMWKYLHIGHQLFWRNIQALSVYFLHSCKGCPRSRVKSQEYILMKSVICKYTTPPSLCVIVINIDNTDGQHPGKSKQTELSWANEAGGHNGPLPCIWTNLWLKQAHKSWANPHHHQYHQFDKHWNAMQYSSSRPSSDKIYPQQQFRVI